MPLPYNSGFYVVLLQVCHAALNAARHYELVKLLDVKVLGFCNYLGLCVCFSVSLMPESNSSSAVSMKAEV